MPPAGASRRHPASPVASAASLTIADVSSEPELLRGVIIDWAGVLTNPLPGTVRAWADAEGIDWDTYVACMRSWLEDDAYLPGAIGNPVHALERGDCPPRSSRRPSPRGWSAPTAARSRRAACCGGCSRPA